MNKVLIVLIAVLVLIGFSIFSSYNKFVNIDEGINGAWAQVENQLQRRNDLIPNLVATVKGYAGHEREVFEHVADARAKLGGAKTIEDKIAGANELSSALARLLVIVERYPDLKANQNFLKLQDELAGTENRLSVERKRYNEKVLEYNQLRRRFPSNILAGIFNFKERPYFETAAPAKEAPMVDFGK